MTDVAEVLAALDVDVCECGHATRVHSLHGCQTILGTLGSMSMGPPCPCRLTSRHIQATALQPLIDAEVEALRAKVAAVEALVEGHADNDFVKVRSIRAALATEEPAT